jgi:hypothetical protein
VNKLLDDIILQVLGRWGAEPGLFSKAVVLLTPFVKNHYSERAVVTALSKRVTTARSGPKIRPGCPAFMR